MILALDTSSARGSLALGEKANGDGGGAVALLERREFATGRRRGGELFRELDALLRAAEKAGARRRLEAILVGLGPGSYAGVRLAAATAAGLALAAGAALVGRPSAEALATDAPAWHAVGDARRGLYYYAAVSAGRCVRGPELLERDAVLDRLAARPGWPVLAESAELDSLLPVTEICLPDAARFLSRAPDAAELAAAGRGRPLEPIYLRPPSITLPPAAVRAAEPAR